MSMWRQYIVLRDRSGQSAQGFVKLFFTHQSCNISASMARRPQGSYLLYVWDGAQLKSWPMHAVGPDQRLQVKHPLQNGRIEAAVADQDGRMVALGESDDPRADWVAMQTRIQGLARAKAAPQEKAPETAGIVKAPTAPEPDKETARAPLPEEGVKEQSAAVCEEESTAPEKPQTPGTKTTCDDAAPALGEKRQAEHEKAAVPWQWQAAAEDSATWRQAHGEAPCGPAQPMPGTPRPEQSELPLIEQLLQKARPLQQEEQEESVPFDEIARIIQQELAKNRGTEGAPPIVIGADIETLAKQAADAAAEPVRTRLETEETRVAEGETAEERAVVEEIVETEQEPTKETQGAEAVTEEEHCQSGAEEEPAEGTAPGPALPPEEPDERPAEQGQAPAAQNAALQQTRGEDDPAPPRGPMLGGEYAGQWCWKRIEAAGAKGYYLLGCVERGGVNVATAVAVPGAYAPQPPAYLQGFSIYRDGFWVLAQDCETGRTLAV